MSTFDNVRLNYEWLENRRIAPVTLLPDKAQREWRWLMRYRRKLITRYLLWRLH